jgi:hypothetical protein
MRHARFSPQLGEKPREFKVASCIEIIELSKTDIESKITPR